VTGPPRPADAHLALPASERVKVNEIFYSLQGESTAAGRPCVLVRLTGCQMRCTWCDSAYAFHEGAWQSRAEVLAAVARFGCPLVELTGGEPLLQPGARPLLRALADAGYEVLLETGGGVSIAEVDPRVRRIVDIKCPASGEAANNRWENLALLAPRDEIKLVLADRGDYEWARDLVRRERLAERVSAVHFSPVVALPERPGTGLDPTALAEWILADRLPVRFQLQLHKLLWGAATRGV
jgi:7-carboxy-7-deazaguanine synthase